LCLKVLKCKLCTRVPSYFSQILLCLPSFSAFDIAQGPLNNIVSGQLANLQTTLLPLTISFFVQVWGRMGQEDNAELITFDKFLTSMKHFEYDSNDEKLKSM